MTSAMGSTEFSEGQLLLSEKYYRLGNNINAVLVATDTSFAWPELACCCFAMWISAEAYRLFAAIAIGYL